MIELLASPATWVSLATLTALEIVLGIDNIIFISILAGRLPKAEQGRAQKLGLGFALLTRLALLFTISWIMGMNQPLVTVASYAFTGRDLILLGGGLFLMFKATHEIFEKLEVKPSTEAAPQAGKGKLLAVVLQIMLIDIVFSLDSVITAVGMVNHISIMITAMVIAVAVMMVFANSVSNFVNQHPSMKVLALAFLLLIGFLLVAESFGQHVSKGMVYFAMAFSLVVELVNMRVRKAQLKPVKLHSDY